MRVLYCTRGDSPHDQRFLTALGQSGHEVYALRLQACTPQTPAGVTEVPWEGLQGPLKLSQVPILSARLRTLLHNLEPDLVHAGPIQDVAYLIGQAGFHPLLTMSWGFDLMKDAYLSPLKRWQTRWTLAHSDMLMLDCQATAERAISFGFPRERICVFPWGVDLTKFSPQSCVAAGKAWRQQQGWNDAIVLLCLRAWEPNYGVDVLARAFVRAAQQNPALRLILLNEGSESAKIRSILRSGGVEERVYFGGHIPNADLTTYFGASDLYISPAHVDGSSVSLLEAMACGLPAIVSDIPANLEWIKEGENGWIFPDGDDQALAQAILQAATLDWRTLSLAARQVAVERADWSKNFQKLLKCYQETVDYGKVSKA